MPTQPWILKPETAAESLRILRASKAELIPKEGERCALAAALASGTPCADAEWSVEIHKVSFQLPGTGGQLEVTCTPVFAWVVWVNSIPFAARVFTAVNDLGGLHGWESLQVLGLNGVKSDKQISDIEAVARLRNLRVLDVSRCDSLSNLNPLGSLITLQSLYCGSCHSLRDLDPVAGLPRLKDLDVSSCSSLNSLRGLAGSMALESLWLSYGRTLCDLGPLMEIATLNFLDVRGCYALSDLRVLAHMRGLTTLDLSWCHAVTDLSALVSLTGLRTLCFRQCNSLRDLSPLASLVSLDTLIITGHESLSSVGYLSALTSLKHLDVSDWNYLSDLSPIARLTALCHLDLSGCSSLSDLSSLGSLTSLEYLALSRCASVIDLNPLAGLTTIRSLTVGPCNGLTSLGSMVSLKGLQKLAVRSSKSMNDLSCLTGMKALQEVELNACASISDLGPLTALTALNSLKVTSCKSLSDLTPLSSLATLQSLDIRYCVRIRTVETLRGCSQLREIGEEHLHPTVTAELLADLAGRRRDFSMIEENAATWLKEAMSSLRENLLESEVFAASLARAFALLGNTSIGDEFQTFLQSAPDFPVKPWKDWFLTTKRESGFDLLQRRIDAIPPAELSPGAIGGASAALPDDQASQPEQTWARAWLAAIEQHHADRGSALRPAAAELCLALARLGEFAALDRWLQRFTDPDDSSAVDQVHAALAAWHLAALRIDDALAHVAATASSDYRDPVLAEVARFLCDAEPVRASETLLLIGAESVRGELVREFAEKPAMVDTPEAVHRLLVAAGTDGETLGWLIRQVATQRPDDAVLQALSREVQPDPAALSDWQLGQWEVLRKHWLLRHEARFGTKQ